MRKRRLIKTLKISLIRLSRIILNLGLIKTVLLRMSLAQMKKRSLEKIRMKNLVVAQRMRLVSKYHNYKALVIAIPLILKVTTQALEMRPVILKSLDRKKRRMMKDPWNTMKSMERRLKRTSNLLKRLVLRSLKKRNR